MKAADLIRGVVAMALAVFAVGRTVQAPEAQAQVNVVRCESYNSQYAECQFCANGVVRLGRQLSESACIQGRTWDYDGARGRIWVDRGCRAEFVIESGPGFGGAPFGGAPFGAAPFGYGGGQPRIATLRNGDTEVGFDSGCTVVYDRGGRRTYYRPSCNGEEVRIADDTVTRGAGGYGAGRPEVNMGPNGGEVYFRDNDCMVYYDSRGRRSSSRRECTSEQLRLADREIANYR